MTVRSAMLVTFIVQFIAGASIVWAVLSMMREVSESRARAEARESCVSEHPLPAEQPPGGPSDALFP